MLKRLGIEAERWRAVDGRAKPLAELEKEWVADGVLKEKSEIVNCRDRLDSYKQSVIGLLASTALLWRHLDKQAHEWTLILEDDCELHPCLGSDQYVRNMWSMLPADADFVYFGCQLNLPTVDYLQPYVGSREPITAMCEDVNPFFVRMRNPIFGAYAYAVRKRLLPTLLATFPMTSAVDCFQPKDYAIYAIKGPSDWWKRIAHSDEGHLFWGVAAPRAGQSTIAEELPTVATKN